mmetsp:Transcript_13415/g.11911  ORF Transcript_13415/g.11911 Transcript_13415/m.11911 type:complete len:86 (+) Transcript_13415:280-537(+)
MSRKINGRNSINIPINYYLENPERSLGFLQNSEKLSRFYYENIIHEIYEDITELNSTKNYDKHGFFIENKEQVGQDGIYIVDTGR